MGSTSLARDKASLDIFWLKDESLEDSENLPVPGVIAVEIVEVLESALEPMRLIAEDLREGVGAALREPISVFGRYRGNVVRCVVISPGVLLVHRGIERLRHDGAFFGRQPRTDDEAAILVVVKIKFTRGMAGHGLFTRGEATDAALDAAISAHQFFDLGGGRMMCESSPHFSPAFYCDGAMLRPAKATGT